MRVIPYNSFKVKSGCAPDEINVRLKGVVTIGSQSLYTKAVTTPFIGNLREDGFKFSLSGYDPITCYYRRNLFNPQIVGKYKIYDDYTLISIKQRPAWPIIIVTLVWMIPVVFGILACAILLLQGESFEFPLLIPLIMMILMLAMINILFWDSANSSKEILVRTL